MENNSESNVFSEFMGVMGFSPVTCLFCREKKRKKNGVLIFLLIWHYFSLIFWQENHQNPAIIKPIFFSTKTNFPGLSWPNRPSRKKHQIICTVDLAQFQHLQCMHAVLPDNFPSGPRMHGSLMKNRWKLFQFLYLKICWTLSLRPQQCERENPLLILV